MSTIREIAGGLTGGLIQEVTGYERLIYTDLTVPFEPSRLYRIRARIKNTVRPADSTRNKIRVGVEGLAADGETLVDVEGSDTLDGQYFAAAELVDMETRSLDVWYEFTGFLKGQGPYVANANSSGNPCGLNSAVASIYPVVWVNCTDGDGTCQVDTVFLDILPENADQLAESDTRKWAAESGATVGAVVGTTLKDAQGDVVNEEGILNANQQWVDISGNDYSGGEAVAALNTDVSAIANLSCAGRTGVFNLGETAAIFGGMLCYLDSTTGKMWYADIEDAVRFTAMTIQPGSGIQKMALPGSVLRNDSWNWVPGKDVYASWASRGLLTQIDPPEGISRFKVGYAIATHLLFFNPQNNFAVDVGSFAAMSTYNTGMDIPKGIAFWNGGLYLGCTNGKILRSIDYGLTFTTVYNLGASYTFNAFAAFGGYLYACTDHSPGFVIARTYNGTSWSVSHANATSDPYAADLAVFNGYLAVGSSGSAAKTWASSDGASFTLRYTSPTEPTFCQFAPSGSNLWAFIGGVTAKMLRSINATSYSISATYTGSQVAGGAIGYNAGGVDWIIAFCGDTGKVYANASATPNNAGNNELSPPSVPNGFFIVDGTLYLAGGDESTWGLYKRTLSGTTPGWEIYRRSVKAGFCRRYVLADNNYVYFLMEGQPVLYKIPRPHQIIT